MNLPGFDIISLLKRFGLPLVEKAAVDALIRPRMEAAVLHIVETMTAHGKTPDKIGPQLCVHKALYWLWESLLPGTIADTIRDKQDADVWRAVSSKPPVPASLEPLVRATMEAALANVGSLLGKP
jgi:hypothetical protein